MIKQKLLDTPSASLSTNGESKCGCIEREILELQGSIFLYNNMYHFRGKIGIVMMAYCPMCGGVLKKL